MSEQLVATKFLLFLFYQISFLLEIILTKLPLIQSFFFFKMNICLSNHLYCGLLCFYLRGNAQILSFLLTFLYLKFTINILGICFNNLL